MAYDGYRNQYPGAFSEQPPYPYDSQQQQPYDPASYYQPVVTPFPPEPQSRSRASSTAPRPNQAGQVYDAVNHAFDQSPAASAVDPALIAQITEQVRRQVIDQLKNSVVNENVAAQHAQQPPLPNQYLPRSPTSSTTASVPPRDVYTPPSPDKRDQPSYRPPSPEPPAQDPHFYDARESVSTNASTGYARRDLSPTTTESTSRPQPVKRAMTEESPLEKIWQPLFDDGQPTERLGQFLRGLAIHIIDDYEPKKSIVIAPAKMRKFYDDVRVSDETYPWTRIFELSNATISKIYRDLKCQHHLVQDQYHEVPSIPALTPCGFETFMTALIQAHPETEFQRLAKAVMNMPISNADDIKERFPKELPRRLFPQKDNLQAQQRCAAALSADGKIPIPKSTSFPPPPPTQPGGSFSGNFSSSFTERERKPYAGFSSDTAVEEEGEDATPLAIPIERERKPYSAAPGGGKTYEDGNTASGLKLDFLDGRPGRSHSTATGRPTADHPATSASSKHYRTGSNLNGRRARSPSFGSGAGYGTRSDSNVGDIPSSQYSSNLYRDDDDRRYSKASDSSRKDDYRRGTEDSSKTGYGPPRSSSIYDDDYYRSRDGSSGYGSYPPPPRY